jgi:hypothetical protein
LVTPQVDKDQAFQLSDGQVQGQPGIRGIVPHLTLDLHLKLQNPID